MSSLAQGNERRTELHLGGESTWLVIAASSFLIFGIYFLMQALFSSANGMDGLIGVGLLTVAAYFGTYENSHKLILVERYDSDGDAVVPGSALLRRHNILGEREYFLDEYSGWSREVTAELRAIALHESARGEAENASAGTRTTEPRKTVRIYASSFETPSKLTDFLSRHLPERPSDPDLARRREAAEERLGTERFATEFARFRREKAVLSWANLGLGYCAYGIADPPQLIMAVILLAAPAMVAYAHFRRQWIPLLDDAPSKMKFVAESLLFPTFMLAFRCMRDISLLGSWGTATITAMMGLALLFKAGALLALLLPREELKRKWNSGFLMAAFVCLYAYILLIGLNWLGPARTVSGEVVAEVQGRMETFEKSWWDRVQGRALLKRTWQVHTGWLGWSWVTKEVSGQLGSGGEKAVAVKPVSRQGAERN